MLKKTILVVLLLYSGNGFAQSYDSFKIDFKKALNKDFSEKSLNGIFKTYDALLTPGSDITRLMQNIKGAELKEYPLYNFKSDTLYTKHIKSLINSQNYVQRILAYLVISASGDTSFNAVLVGRIKTEEKKGARIWAGMGLFELKYNHTTPLFDFLVRDEDFGDAHLIPMYFRMNKDSIQQTAYNMINSTDEKAKVLAAQSLAVTTLNSKTEQLLKAAVRDWDINIKGYAIYSIGALQIGNLLESFKPLLDSQQVRSVAMDALANSPTAADVDYLKHLTNRPDTIQSDLLDCFFMSKNINNLRYWLTLISTHLVPANYYFQVMHQPLIKSDSILPDLQTTIEKMNNPNVLSTLLDAMRDRRDEKSTTILISLLKNKDAGVREDAARALKGNHSPLLVKILPALMRDTGLRVTTFTDLVIENKIDTLQSIFEQLYKPGIQSEWSMSAVDYLSEFPLERDKEIFREILIKNDKEQYNENRDASFGLAKLHDASSIDLIIAACEKESERSDYNSMNYLKALAILKGSKAKAEIEKYKNSNEEQVKKLAATLLKNWE